MQSKHLVVLASELSSVCVAGRQELEQSGYHVITCANVKSVVDTLNMEVPEVLIIDWDMHTEDDVPVVLSVTRRRRSQSLPMLVLFREGQLADWMWESMRSNRMSFLFSLRQAARHAVRGERVIEPMVDCTLATAVIRSS